MDEQISGLVDPEPSLEGAFELLKVALTKHKGGEKNVTAWQ